jgi:hypothetical protein
MSRACALGSPAATSRPRHYTTREAEGRFRAGEIGGERLRAFRRKMSRSVELALWSANSDALNVVYDEKEKGSLMKLNFVSPFFFVAMFYSRRSDIFSAVGLSSLFGLAIVGLRWPLFWL